MNGFTWLLLSFPIYLLAKGRFVDYVKIAAPKPSGPIAKAEKQTTKGLGGLNNNQALT